MKVIYDAQIFRLQQYGGISRYFCELASRISHRSGYWARIVAPNHQNAYAQALPPNTLLGWQMPANPRWRRISHFAGRALSRASFAGVRPNIIHETYYGDTSPKRRGAIHVLTIYDMIHELFPSSVDSRDTTAINKRLAAQRADHVICISHATRIDAQRILGLPSHKVSVTHLAASLGVPNAPIRPDSPKDRPYLLYVGQRAGYKNFDAMLRSISSSPALRELRVVCYGGGAFSPSERALAMHLGFNESDIVWETGDDERLSALYSGAAAFIYPSKYEGFGIPPLEAMQCGCPVVCANAGSIPEIVQGAGEYFDPFDLDDMRIAMEKVVLSPTRQDELRWAGTRQAEKFSWNRCADETAAIYARLVQQRSTHA